MRCKGWHPTLLQDSLPVQLNGVRMSQAGALFYFMLVDGKDLPLEPKLHLSRADQRRLQRYTACVALRHQGCLALLSTSSASRNAELHPRLTERGAAPFGATPLQASMSAHPPLQGQAAV